MSVAAETNQTQAAATRFSELDQALGRGATLLTPNQRTARSLLLRYDRAQAEGAKTWQSPGIYAWAGWAASLWRTALVTGVETRVLLNSLQERELWRRIIDGAPAETLRGAPSQARLCESAMSLLGAYDVTGRFGRGSYPLQALSADAERFAGWFAQFEERCRHEALLPASHLAIELAEHLNQRRIVPDREYLLYGFNALEPAQTRLVAALQAAGATVQHMAATVPRTAAPTLQRCESGAAELRQCARWVRQQLQRETAASVAVVVPDLGDVRGELERELRRSVAPELADVTAAERAALYDFSSGRPLDSLPMVQDALRLLRWCAGAVSHRDAGALLRSVHLHLAASPMRGAELDMHVLRELPALRGEVLIRDVIAAMPNTDGETAANLRALQSAARSLQRGRDSYAVFADEVREVLRGAGWPGADSMNSEEHQALERWEETLDRVATLDLLGGRTGFDGFVAALSAATGDTIFAPGNTGAPVQVMTVPEAAGSTADALWFLHADENTFPLKQAMHPLLPWTLQRDLGMPGVDTRTDEAAARGSLARLLDGAGASVFSYSSTTADGAQRPSPPVLEITGEASARAVSIDDEAPVLLEEHEDIEPLPDLPEGVISGGAGIVLAQAQCAFRAFAERRLFASPVDTREAGFTTMERGDQVHEVLERFWSAVRTQAELIRMSAPSGDGSPSLRDTLLTRCIDALFPAAAQAAWDAAYVEVQRKRLFRLLTAWLDFEAKRPSFTVAATELEVKDAQLGPLHLKLRVDRVDRVVANGTEGTILIDYKTGPAFAREWMGERPDQPQLPVYAIAGGIEGVLGLAFGAVRVGSEGMKLEGTADDPALLGSRHKNTGPFSDKVEAWRRDLAHLAEAFAAGDAAVLPKDYPRTCERCGQRMLCRVDPATLLQLDELPDEEDESGMPWS